LFVYEAGAAFWLLLLFICFETRYDSSLSNLSQQLIAVRRIRPVGLVAERLR